MRCGRVSSREAERATRAIVSTKAPAGTLSAPSSFGSGSFGKSSEGSVRRWKRALPDTTSTSCCELRYSSESSSWGSERTTSSRRRPGRTTLPSSAALTCRRPTRMPISMSVAWSSSRPPSTLSSTPDRVWIALRVETPRTAIPSRDRNVSRETVNFMGRLPESSAGRGCGNCGHRSPLRDWCWIGCSEGLLIVSGGAAVSGAVQGGAGGCRRRCEQRDRCAPARSPS